ncbi:hypothetical protein FD755_016459 [Muntiacus reevesi]|uniref:RRM domain-containing protein n=1 Tax=Muntiacus reevesi TaxID=9886 RepID=A0A5N3XCR3_MUNRE|nr:hypothetical protein FD755_016459 [Muntiacus reevesi]
MVDAGKPEVVMGPGYDNLHGHLLELQGEPRQKPHPPKQEKQPSQRSSSSNEKSELREKSTGNKKANRFHSYSKDKNSGIFISNIPYDMKWQAIKALMREKGLWCG